MFRSHLSLLVCMLLCAATTALAQAPPVPTRGALCWYSFEALTNGKVADRTGHGLDLEVVGQVGLAAGKVGQALALTGGGYLQVADNPQLDLTREVTLECWVYPTQPGAAARLIDKSTVGKADGYLLDTHPSNHIRMITLGGALQVPEEAGLPLNQWTHVVAVTSAEEGMQTIYYNGKPVAEAGWGGGLAVNDNPLRIGADSTGSSRFVGMIDEARVYPWALTPEQAAQRFGGEEVQGPPPEEEVALQRPVALKGEQVEIDYAALVSYYDVVYQTPTLYPFEALPLGNGNLGVMAGNQGGLQWKLNNGRYWRQNPFMQCTSGVTRLVDTPAFVEQPQEFVERLNLYDATVTTQATTAQGEVRVTSFVAEGRDLVVVKVEDQRTGPVQRKLTLEIPYPEAELATEGDLLLATCPSGFPAGHQLACVAGLAARVTGLTGRAEKGAGGALTLTLEDKAPATYVLYLAAPVFSEAQGDPVAGTRKLLEEAVTLGWDKLLAEHTAYWHDFWTKSAIFLTSRDGTADYMANLWYLNLYWTACQSRGPFCPKFNGGNFLVDGNDRGWGGSYWYQNTREIFWPVLAANHPELAQPFLDLYTSTMAAHRRHARELFKVGGLQVQETMTVLGEGDKSGNPYTFLYLSTGLECAHQFYTIYEFTRDERFLREQVYPFLKDAVQFYREWAKKSTDGKYHIYPCDARETYWRVQDGHVDLVGLRKCLPILIRESERLGLDAGLRPQWQEFLDNLAPLPLTPDGQRYAPCVFLQDHPDLGNELIEKLYPRKNTSYSLEEKKNSESVECDLLYPWGLAGVGLGDFELARRTYEGRPFPYPGCGWDPSAIWAARLGLGEEAARMLLAHANANQVWPQGFWNSPAGIKYGGTLVDAPYFDSSGVNATALEEMLLQSYAPPAYLGRATGMAFPFRAWPAVPASWSGLFRLRAQPNFIVTSEISGGQVRYLLIECLSAGPCTVTAPWEGGFAVRSSDGMSMQGGAGGGAGVTVSMTFEAQPGQSYLVYSPQAPPETFKFAPLKPEANQGPRWPGRRKADQPWRPGQRIMLGLDAQGHPLRVKMQETKPAG